MANDLDLDPRSNSTKDAIDAARVGFDLRIYTGVQYVSAPCLYDLPTHQQSPQPRDLLEDDHRREALALSLPNRHNAAAQCHHQIGEVLA